LIIDQLKIALIQPQFAPNLYDLILMIRADRVILLDEDIWSRKGRTHRAKITDSEWINLPIKTEDKKKSIREIRIDHSEDWYTPFWNGLYHNFHSATYFDYFEVELLALFNEVRDSKLLIDFNLEVFQKLLRFLEIDVSFDLASQSKFELNDYSEIYQEHQSKNYIRQLPNALQMEIQNPKIRKMDECSILHLLLTQGPESFRLLDLLG